MTKKILWLGVLAITLVFGITVVRCDNGTTDDNDVVTQGTYQSTDAADNTYILIITKNTPRAAFTPVKGAIYELIIRKTGLNDKVSKGTISDVDENGELTLMPNNSVSDTLSVTISGEKMTAINGTITVEDGDSVTFPGTLTPAEIKDFAGGVAITPHMDVKINTELTAVYDGIETITKTYQWKKDGVNIGTNSSKFTPKDMGAYTVTISAAGYKNQTSTIVDVNNPALSSFTGILTINPNVGAIGTKLTADYYNGTENVKYQWRKDGAISVGENSREYTPTEAGTYTVNISAAGYNSRTSFPVWITDSYVLPENRPVAERWTKWVDPGSTATLVYSVASDGVCTITVGGTAEPNNATDGWYAWKAQAYYAYTAKADASYTYTFQAWTQSGTRDLHFEYYEDNDTQTYISTTFPITSTRETYTVTGEKLPRGGGRNILFQCADQTGTFYVKVLSITEN